MSFRLECEAGLRHVLERRQLAFVFQPIVDLSRSTLFGYEALMRGPAGTPLEKPDDLLRVAKQCGLASTLEVDAAKGAIEAFAALQLQGKLFINLRAPLITGFGREGGTEGIEDYTTAKYVNVLLPENPL